MQSSDLGKRGTDKDGYMEDLILRMSMARDISEIISIVRSGARHLLGADGITFILREGDECSYVAEDAIAPLWQGQRFPLTRSMAGAAILTQETIIVENVDTDPRVPAGAYAGKFVKSLVIAPVRHTDKVGAIGAYWARAQRPSGYSVQNLQRIANAASMAMTNVALIKSLAEAREESQRARDAMVLTMASLAETRHHETGNHIRRTQHYVRALAEAARGQPRYATRLSDELVDLLYKSAPLHDIGKVGIPDRILLKPGRLDNAEYEVMKTHAEIGRAAISVAESHIGTSTPFLTLAKEIAYTHHEWWDGSGYPQGLKGEEIPISGRIMAIADVYDALVSERNYKTAMSHQEAVDLIVSESGTHFNPDLIEVFIGVAPVFDSIHQQFADVA